MHDGSFLAADGSGTSLANLTREQMEALMTLMNYKEEPQTEQMKGEKVDTEWIIDTGASHHITGTLTILRNVRDIAGRPVGNVIKIGILLWIVGAGRIESVGSDRRIVRSYNSVK